MVAMPGFCYTLGMASTFQDHFSSHASSYATFRPRYPAALGSIIAAHAQGVECVVECGAGNGQLSHQLVQHFNHVVATDASAQQISHAKPHPRISFQVANASALPLADHSVDAVTVAQAVHWFALDAFYDEVRRVSKPGGLLALITYAEAELDGEVQRLLHQFNRITLAPYWPKERLLVETGYRTLPFPFTQIEVEPLTMEAHWSFHQFVGYVQTWSAVRALEKAGKDVLMQQFSAELKEAWGDPQTIRAIRWPVTLKFGRVD